MSSSRSRGRPVDRGYIHPCFADEGSARACGPRGGAGGRDLPRGGDLPSPSACSAAPGAARPNRDSWRPGVRADPLLHPDADGHGRAPEQPVWPEGISWRVRAWPRRGGSGPALEEAFQDHWRWAAYPARGVGEADDRRRRPLRRVAVVPCHGRRPGGRGHHRSRRPPRRTPRRVGRDLAVLPAVAPPGVHGRCCCTRSAPPPARAARGDAGRGRREPHRRDAALRARWHARVPADDVFQKAFG